MSDELKWNKSKHDEHVVTAAAQHIEEQRRRIKTVVATEWTKWKQALLKKARKAKSMTQPELIRELYTIHDRVGNLTRDMPGAQDFRNFSMEALDEKISTVIATDCGRKNLIVEYIPLSVQSDPNRMVVNERAVFETPDELLKAKFVARYASKGGFVGLVRSGLWIKALYKDGEAVPVGICINKVGIEKLPTEFEIKKELGGKDQNESK